MSDPRYPVGPFQPPDQYSAEVRESCIDAIADMPATLRATLALIGDENLERSYREGGWTARQVVHHLADSHLNSYVRFKLAVTEDMPSIKPYDEKAWAELEDARSADVEASVTLLEGLHRRWAAFLRSLPNAAFERAFDHPERGRVALDETLAYYAWHGRHHVAHLRLIADADHR